MNFLMFVFVFCVSVTFGGRKNSRGRNNDRPTYNGCNVDDLVIFKNTLSQFIDIQTFAQNADTVTNELTSFTQDKMIDNFLYHVVDGVNNNTIITYYSRDDFLNNWVSLINTDAFGVVWFYTNEGYGICNENNNNNNNNNNNKNNNDYTSATYIARGGDKSRNYNSGINIHWINRWEVKFIDINNGHGVPDWKVESISVKIYNDFGFFVAN